MTTETGIANDDRDDEEFCPTCLAGLESSEHLTQPCGEATS